MQENVKNSQPVSTTLETKYGFPVYAANPSVPIETEIKKSKRAQIGDAQNGLIVDNGTGEILGQGGAIAYKWEEVDKTRFVKLYLEGLKQAAGLSKAGLAVFELVYNQVRENPGKDTVLLSPATVKNFMTKDQYHRGIRDLLTRQFLFRSENPGLYFVNIKFMFNGDRLAFVKGYKLKDSGRQAELPLEEPKKIAAE